MTIDMIPDKVIRAWMDGEIARLGEWFRDFEITWHLTESTYQLTIWSHQKYDYGKLSHPFGHGFTVAEVVHMDGETLPLVQSEGRKLYHRLKKDYVIHRDLGK